MALTATLEQIRNYRRVDDRLASSGQPNEAELAAIAAAGYGVVINLALHDDPRYSLANEASTVTALGLTYIHIPVQFAAPTTSNLERFSTAMSAHRAERVWVHCAANYRVSAFIGLHRVRVEGWSRPTAFALMDSLWQPDATWSQFIANHLPSAG